MSFNEETLVQRRIFAFKKKICQALIRLASCHRWRTLSNYFDELRWTLKTITVYVSLLLSLPQCLNERFWRRNIWRARERKNWKASMLHEMFVSEHCWPVLWWFNGSVFARQSDIRNKGVKQHWHWKEAVLWEKKKRRINNLQTIISDMCARLRLTTSVWGHRNNRNPRSDTVREVRRNASSAQRLISLIWIASKPYSLERRLVRWSFQQ